MTGGATGAQRRVVEHRGGPLLVLGGPGTGKTRALELRYVSLACSPGLGPHRVLVLCTSRRHAMDTRDRLVWALPHRATVEVPAYTWHALAYHLVTRNYPVLGYPEPPVLLTAPEQWAVVRGLLSRERPTAWPVWGSRLEDRAFVDEVADFCLRVQQRMMPDDDLEALGRHRQGWDEVVRLFRRYRDHLLAESRLDYAGLIASAVRLLDEAEDVRESVRRRFPHVLVDDGEEMSAAHRELLARLETSELVVAADPDAGIETFRGAEPDWVHGFGSFFGSHATVVLDQGRRVGEPLASAALALAVHNDPDATHRPRPAAEETAFECRLFSSPAEEVDAAARELRRLHLLDGVPWGEMAVLVSQPAHLLAPLERALARWDVPHRPMSGERPLASEPAVACFLDLVRVAVREEGWEQLLPNLLSSPLAGLDYPARRRLEREAWQARRTVAEVVEEAGETAELRRLREVVLAHREGAEECFWHVWQESSYYDGLRRAAAEDAAAPEQGQLDALVAFSHALGRFVERRRGRASIDDYLHEAGRADFGGDPWLPPSCQDPADAVALLTFHAAKGREWDTVIVAGCLDAWIPKGRRAQGLFDPFALEISDLAEREVEAIADDRRTFYVAATRARRRVLFTVSPGPSGRGRPSRFLTELAGRPPDEVVPGGLPPLTAAELRCRLRLTLESGGSAPDEKAAALLALAEVPGTDPSRWYGRWEWTEGAEPLVDGELRTSYSRLGVYDNCGLQYLLQTVLGLDPASTHAMKFGTWIHALFQAVHEGTIADSRTLVEEYRRLFDERVFPNRTVARQYRRDGEKMLETFWLHESRHHAVKAEHWFEFPHAGAVLRGRIDRVDRIKDNLKLTDYKTARWAVGKDEARESLQLAIYHLAARIDPELKAMGRPVAARLLYPGATYADGKPIERNQGPEDADRVLERLPGLIADVLAERFAPAPEADCTWCAMKPLCPLWPQGREVGS